MGKIIYQPKGAAAEYSEWAANLYNGCSASVRIATTEKGASPRYWAAMCQR